jgi:hypothetical protein
MLLLNMGARKNMGRMGICIQDDDKTDNDKDGVPSDVLSSVVDGLDGVTGIVVVVGINVVLLLLLVVPLVVLVPVRVSK